MFAIQVYGLEIAGLGFRGLQFSPARVLHPEAP